jgi:hypothetical protein
MRGHGVQALREVGPNTSIHAPRKEPARVMLRCSAGSL